MRRDDPDRDRFLLSKGHGPAAYYAVLAAKGFVDAEEPGRLRRASTSRLGYHPDRLLVPGVEISSGSLGHGLPIALGMTLALDARQQAGARVVCLVGDAELDEGSNWEAVQLAGRLGLGRLTVVVVDNRSSTYHWPDGVGARFALEGWSAARVDGRDHDALERALAATGARPQRGRGGGAAMTTMRKRFYERATRGARTTIRVPRSSWPRSAPPSCPPATSGCSTSASASS